ncbi:MAG: RluA family pseudouridine synthase [Gemmatimonadetes bacterium]|nr:RluA family pseudouridine synthase [Gemmatimonadota bacterium]
MPRQPRPGKAARWIAHTVTGEEAGKTVEQLLIDSMRISRRMIQRLTRASGIQLNRRPAYLARLVRQGDVVTARLDWAEESGLRPVPMELAIAFEAADLLVLDKPPFVLVHPPTPQHDATLAHGVAHHLLQSGVQTKVRPIHRIDRDTSGLVLFAKTAVAHHRLDLQLRDHTLRREYLAFVEGGVENAEGEIDAPIGKHARSTELRAVRPDGEPAITRYRVVERLAGATLLTLELETGRTHQIRVHLAHLHHPLIGDRAYGARESALLRRQALHCSRLSFLHPTTETPQTVEAPLPADLMQLHERLRLG